MSDEKRTTLRLPDHVHMRVKLIGTLVGKSMQDCMEEAIADWIEKHGGALGDVLRQAEDITGTSQQDSGGSGGEISHRPIAAKT